MTDEEKQLQREHWLKGTKGALGFAALSTASKQVRSGDFVQKEKEEERCMECRQEGLKLLRQNVVCQVTS